MPQQRGRDRLGSVTSSQGAVGAVTLLDGACFCISSRRGDIVPGGTEGLYLLDTRLLSELVLLVDGRPPDLLDAVQEDPFAATFVLACLPPDGGDETAALVIERHRRIGQGMREDIVVRNLTDEATYCRLELHVATDLAEVGGVRAGRARAVPDITATVHADGLDLIGGRGRRRGVRVVAPGAVAGSSGVLRFESIVPARQTWTACAEVVPVIDGEQLEPRHRCGQALEPGGPSERLERWRRTMPVIETESAALDDMLRCSADDLGALRVFDPDVPERVVVAAGAPWSMSLLGRDALLTSWMALLVDPELALGTLETLARFQGADVDPRTEEEPGRILRELPFGAGGASFDRGRVTWGAVDTTPLFVMLLGELRRWGLAPEPVERLLPHADRALGWVLDYGDRDGDGYVEYQRPTDRGRLHQGWKDAPGGVRAADGSSPSPPIALAEVQGYVYAAFVARHHFAREAGDDAGAEAWRARADDLRKRFNRDFWLERDQFVALGLDSQKRPIDAICSNAGHCLWTGILDEDKAALVARRLMAPDMFTGWGVRTLSSSMVGYNPVSFQHGSVWPHDNALVAAGLMRYGFVDDAQRIVLAMIDAATARGGRLPELFAGFPRDDVAHPVRCPTSCSPQAWSAAAPLSFLRTLLRFEPWVPAGKLWLAPVLPPELGRLRIEGVPLLGGRITLDVEDEAAKIEGLAADVELITTPRLS
ncbi:MAG: amylo-alpha-1,6-glucosidase [Acidimicrobiia bacterium]